MCGLSKAQGNSNQFTRDTNKTATQDTVATDIHPASQGFNSMESGVGDTAIDTGNVQRLSTSKAFSVTIPDYSSRRNLGEPNTAQQAALAKAIASLSPEERRAYNLEQLLDAMRRNNDRGILRKIPDNCNDQIALPQNEKHNLDPGMVIDIFPEGPMTKQVNAMAHMIYMQELAKEDKKVTEPPIGMNDTDK